MTPLELARMTVRTTGLVMLALGLLIWTNVARSVVPVHMLVGIVLVAALWAEAALALRVGAKPVLPVVALAWGVLTVAFGVTQERIYVLDSHLPVEVAHLVVGIVAIGLGEALASVGRRGPVAAA